MYSSGSSSSFNASRLPPLLRPEQRPSAGAIGSSSGPPPPPGLLLVGHSMGGVIARAAATAAWDDPHLGDCCVAAA
jgi:pimeloyl-ACP methyl ester carboxylesterase